MAYEMLLLVSENHRKAYDAYDAVVQPIAQMEENYGSY
jgi:hypothetical protein